MYLPSSTAWFLLSHVLAASQDFSSVFCSTSAICALAYECVFAGFFFFFCRATYALVQHIQVVPAASMYLGTDISIMTRVLLLSSSLYCDGDCYAILFFQPIPLCDWWWRFAPKYLVIVSRQLTFAFRDRCNIYRSIRFNMSAAQVMKKRSVFQIAEREEPPIATIQFAARNQSSKPSCKDALYARYVLHLTLPACIPRARWFGAIIERFYAVTDGAL